METTYSAPGRLDDLLQVPLKVIPLQELLREKSLSVSPFSNKVPIGGKDRLCRSADSQSPLSKNKVKGHNDGDKPTSHSSPCLFNCCSVPSRWSSKGPFSNMAKFRSQEIKLPNGSIVTIPAMMMDYSEDTLSDVEMKGINENGAEKGLDLSRPLMRKSISSEEGDPVKPQPLPVPKIVPTVRRGRPPKVVVGKVTENPTRFKDFINAQGLDESNNNISYRNQSPKISSGQKDDPITVDGDGIIKETEGNTLKLTFYNDGRKQSVKEFRTNADSYPDENIGAERAYLQEPYIYKNPYGLQLSKILLQKESSYAKSGENEKRWQDKYNDNADNTQTGGRIVAVDKSDQNKSWKQCDELQISRARKRTSSPPNEITQVTPQTVAGTVARGRSSEEERDNGNGESENLINKHLQSVLTSLRYVRNTAAATTNESASTNMSANGRPNSKPTPPHLQQISPPAAQVQNQNNIHFPQQSKPATAAASLLEPWTERTIARIPTRPYLIKNVTYDQPPTNPQNANSQHHPQQPYNQAREQQAAVLLSNTSSSMHSQPKRLKPSPVPIAPATMVRYTTQQHHTGGIMPNVNRYQPGAQTNEHLPTGNSGAMSHYLHNSSAAAAFQQPSHLMAAANERERMMAPYRTGSQQHLQQHHNSAVASPYGSPQQPTTRGLANMASSYHEQLQILQGHGTRLHDSLMVAAAIAVNASSTEQLTQNEYYERLRAFYEYYQRQQLDLPKLSEYYQKANSSSLYPWEGREDALMQRQWRNSMQLQAQRNAGDIGHHELTNIPTHQLAQATHGIMTGIAANRGGSVPNHNYMHPVHPTQHNTGRHNIINLSPPHGSPPSSAMRVQHGHRYNTPGQIQQLRHTQERPSHIAPQNTVRYPPPIPHQQQQRYHQPQQQHTSNIMQHQLNQSPTKIPQHHPTMAPRSSPTQHPQLRNSLGHFTGGSVSDSRLSPHSNISNSAVVGPVVVEDQREGRNYQQQQHHINVVRNTSIQPRALSPLTHIPNFHRQTLELAIKNNFKLASDEAAMAVTTNGNSSKPANVFSHPVKDSVTISRHIEPISPPLPAYTRQNHVTRESSWSNKDNVEGVKEGGILNMSKDLTRAAPIAQQTSVIRRLPQSQPTQNSPPINVNMISRKTPTNVSQHPSENTKGIAMENYHKSLNQRYNLNNNDNDYHPVPTTIQQSGQHLQHEGILKRRINIVRNYTENKELSPPPPRIGGKSPIQLIVGEEEVISANGSPSAVLTTINPVDGERRTLEGENSNRSPAVSNDESSSNVNGRRSKPSSAGSEGGREGGDGTSIWQYDHVVLLDKRTKTYMCKRCYEILKNEQDIRNHLFCKMLAGYVRCHVCLQLLKSDDYSKHLQIHGVRPPDDTTDILEF